MISCNVTTCICGIILILNMMVSYACMVLKEHTNMLHVGVVDCAVALLNCFIFIITIRSDFVKIG